MVLVLSTNRFISSGMQNCKEHERKVYVLQIRIHFPCLAILVIFLTINYNCLYCLKYYTTPYFSFQNFIIVIERLPAAELFETWVQKGHTLTSCLINKNGDNERETWYSNLRDDNNIDITGHCIAVLGSYYKTDQRNLHCHAYFQGSFCYCISNRGVR
jgi:hypothetical protein